MFQVGDYMVHENNGICRVEEITQLKMPGAQKNRMYYVLLPVYTKGSKVYSPVDNSKVVMRNLLTKEEAEDLIKEIPQMEQMQTADLGRGDDPYKAALHSCDCHAWARMLKTLYTKRDQRVRQGKKLVTSDERYLRQAQDHLYQELAMALDITEKEVEKHILEQVKAV